MREFGDTLDLRGQTPFHIKPHPLAARVGEGLDQDVYPGAVNELDFRQVKPHITTIGPRLIQPVPQRWSARKVKFAR